MIVVKQPYRISFLGGSSDLASFYTRTPGKVISTTFDRYIYIFINKRFDPIIRLSYSKIETVDKVDDIQHDLIKAVLKRFNVYNGIEITIISDLPANGTGLGSSSALLVGLIRALAQYTRNFHWIDRTVAELACDIEINELGKPIGKQDQYVAAFCTKFHENCFNSLVFNTDRVECNYISIRKDCMDYLEDNLIMFYTNISRQSSDILAKQKENLINSESTYEDTKKLVKLADNFEQILRKGVCQDYDILGDLLHESWMIKRGLAEGISNNEIDKMYNEAFRIGKCGGKLLGAGGGGFILFYAKPDIQQKLIKLFSHTSYIKPKLSKLSKQEII